MINSQLGGVVFLFFFSFSFVAAKYIFEPEANLDSQRRDLPTDSNRATCEAAGGSFLWELERKC